jgi:hypothetical protein
MTAKVAYLVIWLATGQGSADKEEGIGFTHPLNEQECVATAEAINSLHARVQASCLPPRNRDGFHD